MFKDAMIKYFQEVQKNRKEIFVKEINEKIFYSPVTVADQEWIFARSNGGANSKQFHIFTIVLKAENEDGSKIFSLEDVPILEKLPWRVVTRISNAIQGDFSVEEAKKNSSPTPSSE
jgi:hypothetical protein